VHVRSIAQPSHNEIFDWPGCHACQVVRAEQAPQPVNPPVLRRMRQSAPPETPKMKSNMAQRCDNRGETGSKPDLACVQRALEALAEQGLIVREGGGWKLSPEWAPPQHNTHHRSAGDLADRLASQRGPKVPHGGERPQRRCHPDPLLLRKRGDRTAGRLRNS